MPISINLLAEAQAAEELRRRDPVKRAGLVGAAIVIMVLIWSSSLQVKLIAENNKLSRLQNSLNSKTNEYVQILSNQNKLSDVKSKLTALNRMATNRFLLADMLNSLQHANTEGVQLTKLRIEQSYSMVAEVKPTVVDGTRIPGRPGSSTERSTLFLDAKDASANPGSEAITRFKETLACNSYFQSQRISTNDILLRNLSTPQVDNETGSGYVLFSFECHYPEQTR